MFGFNLDLCPCSISPSDDEADNSCADADTAMTWRRFIRNAGRSTQAASRGDPDCGKTFSGYPARRLDAHHELPEIALSREMETHELAVFRHFADKSFDDDRSRILFRRDQTPSRRRCFPNAG